MDFDDLCRNDAYRNVHLYVNGKGETEFSFTVSVQSTLLENLGNMVRQLKLSTPADRCRLFKSDGVEIGEDEDLVFIGPDDNIFISEGEEFNPMTLVSNYKILETLGEGGYGKVYRARNDIKNEVVAIKEMKMSRSGMKDAEVFNTEARTLCELEHPNIVNLHHAHMLRDHGKALFIMEYCSGGDLRQYVSKKGFLSEDEARIIFTQLTEAVDHCHQKGIIHRDLKLENILMKRAGSSEIKVADFGISGICTDQRSEETRAGSLKYMAPELVSQEDLSARPSLDLWSMGCILYGMVIGKLPFRAKNQSELRENIKEAQFSFPKTPKLSWECKDLISRLLRFSPIHRMEMEALLEHAWYTNRACSDLSRMQELSDDSSGDEPSFQKLAPKDIYLVGQEMQDRSEVVASPSISVVEDVSVSDKSQKGKTPKTNSPTLGSRGSVPSGSPQKGGRGKPGPLSDPFALQDSHFQQKFAWNSRNFRRQGTMSKSRKETSSSNTGVVHSFKPEGGSNSLYTMPTRISPRETTGGLESSPNRSKVSPTSSMMSSNGNQESGGTPNHRVTMYGTNSHTFSRSFDRNKERRETTSSTKTKTHLPSGSPQYHLKASPRKFRRFPNAEEMTPERTPTRGHPKKKSVKHQATISSISRGSHATGGNSAAISRQQTQSDVRVMTMGSPQGSSIRPSGKSTSSMVSGEMKTRLHSNKERGQGGSVTSTVVNVVTGRTSKKRFPALNSARETMTMMNAHNRLRPEKYDKPSYSSRLSASPSIGGKKYLPPLSNQTERWNSKKTATFTRRDEKKAQVADRLAAQIVNSETATRGTAGVSPRMTVKAYANQISRKKLLREEILSLGSGR